MNDKADQKSSEPYFVLFLLISSTDPFYYCDQAAWLVILWAWEKCHNQKSWILGTSLNYLCPLCQLHLHSIFKWRHIEWCYRRQNLVTVGLGLAQNSVFYREGILWDRPWFKFLLLRCLSTLCLKPLDITPVVFWELICASLHVLSSWCFWTHSPVVQSVNRRSWIKTLLQSASCSFLSEYCPTN